MNLFRLDNLIQTIYKLKLRDRVIIAGLIIFLIAYIIYSSILSPQLLNLSSVRKQFIIQRGFIQTKKNKIKRLLALEHRYNKLQQEIVSNNRRFFSDEEAIDFLKGLNRLVERQTGSDLIFIQRLSEEIVSKSVLYDKDGRIYKRLDVRLDIKGRFSNILALIYQLYTFDKLISLKQINIEITKKSPLDLKADFVLSLYLLKERNESDFDDAAE